jgi:hypothetical protein
MAIALTCKIRATGSRRLGGTMVMVFYVMVCVVCCCVCKRGFVLGLGCPQLAHKYDILYYGIILGIVGVASS